MRRSGTTILIGALLTLGGGSAAYALPAHTDDQAEAPASEDTPDWANPASDEGTEIVQLQRDNLRVTVQQLDTQTSLPFDVTLEDATGSSLLFNVTFENTGTATISISNTPEVYVYPAGTTEFDSDNRQSIAWSDTGTGQGALHEKFFTERGLNRFPLSEQGQAEIAQWSGSGIMGGWLPLEPGQRMGYGVLSIDDGEKSKVFQLSLLPSDYLSDEFHLLPKDTDAKQSETDEGASEDE